MIDARRHRLARRLGTLAAAAFATALLVPADAHAGRSSVPVPADFAAADSLVYAPPTSARLSAFRAWAAGARVEELVYVLRRSAAQLGDLERAALEAALRIVPAGRASLRDRLAARLEIVMERVRKPGALSWAAPGPGASSIPSAFRVGLLLPTEGDAAADADAVALGFVTGVLSRRVPGLPPAECVRYSTRAESPGAVAAALDSSAGSVGVVCGGLPPASGLLLAAGSRWRGLPVVFPGPADVAAAQLSSRVWGIGPTGAQRARALASAVAPGPTDRVVLVVSNDADTAFASGFAAACRERGAAIVARIAYAPENASFTSEIRTLIGQRASVLFWDGDPAEAASLLRQLTRERVALRVCGGDGLDPERHHRETRVLLEGVTFAGPDWLLGPDDQARLDAQVRTATGVPANEMNVRGYVAGRIIGAAIVTGALTSDELAVALARLSGPGSGTPGTLDARSQGAELPVYAIAAGRAERAQ